MLRVILIFFLLGIASGFSIAQTFSCTQVYYPKEDAVVWYLTNQNNPQWGPTNTQNYSTANFLDTQVWTWNGSPGKKRAYLANDFENLIDLTSTYIYSCHLNLFNPFSNTAFAHRYGEGQINTTRIYKVPEYWVSTAITWNNQPDIETDEYAEISPIPDCQTLIVIEDILNIDITNVVLTDDHTLESNFHGLVLMQWDEDLDSYFHKMNFASRDYNDPAYWPQICITYVFPEPIVYFDGSSLTVTGVEDLESLFYDHVSYYWLIDNESFEGKTIPFETDNIDENSLELHIKITNSIDSLCEYVFTPVVSAIHNNTLLAIQIYPNPVKENFIVVNCAEGFGITILNASGTLVFSGDNFYSRQPIDISGLKSGVYIVRIITGDDTVNRKLVVE